MKLIYMCMLYLEHVTQHKYFRAVLPQTLVSDKQTQWKQLVQLGHTVEHSKQ
jgi:hypothetical protein